MKRTALVLVALGLLSNFAVAVLLWSVRSWLQIVAALLSGSCP